MVLPAIAAGGRAVAGNATKHTTSKLNPRISKSTATPPATRMFNAANDNQQSSNKHSKKVSTVTSTIKSAEAAAATVWIIFWTAPLYVLQLAGFVFWIMGLGIGVAGEETWIGWGLNLFGITDGAAEVFMGLGMASGLIAVTLSFMVAYMFYSFRRIDCFKGHYSLIIMSLVFAFALVPLSFLPGVWIWCAYVVESQGSKAKS